MIYSSHTAKRDVEFKKYLVYIVKYKVDFKKQFILQYKMFFEKTERGFAMKKFLSVFLSLCFVMSATTIAWAAEDNNDDGDVIMSAEEAENVADSSEVTPVVFVPGLFSSDLYLNPGTEEQTSPITMDTSLTKLIFKSHIIGPTLRVIFGGHTDIDKYIEKAAQIAAPYFSVACDEDGESVNNIGITDFWTDSLANHEDYLENDTSPESNVSRGLCDKIGAENVFLFNYDYRLDLFSYAWDLSDFIDNVKEQTGADKITLVGASLGTCIVSTYVDMFNYKEDLKRVVFLDGAAQGVSEARLFSGDFYLDYDVIVDFINGMAENFKGSEDGYVKIGKYLKTFKKAVKNLIELCQDMTDEEHIDKMFTEILLPIVGNMPSMWECIPYDAFDECVDKMIDIGWLNVDSQLYREIESYHQVQGRLQDNLKNLQEDGVEVAVVANYGFPGLPITSEYTNYSDMMIDTKYASLGAIVADYGEDITSDIMDPDYISPDGAIYSGTCVAPDSTWFCKNIRHMRFTYGTEVNNLVCTIITSEEAPTIDSIKDQTGFGQFTEIDDDYNLYNLE